MKPSAATKTLVWITCLVGLCVMVLGTQALLNGGGVAAPSATLPPAPGSLGELWAGLRALPYRTVMTACLVLGIVQLIYGYFYSYTFQMLGWVCVGVYGASFLVNDAMMITFFNELLAFFGRLIAYVI